MQKTGCGYGDMEILKKGEVTKKGVFNCFWQRSYVFPFAQINFCVLTATAASCLIESICWTKLENLIYEMCNIILYLHNDPVSQHFDMRVEN